MKLSIKYQESYSRGELLLRAFFGIFYIALPHMFLWFFMGIWSSIITMISFWVILFTGRYPESFFEFQVKFMRWQLRVTARLYHLCDGYPAFGLNSEDDCTSLEIEYPESLSKGMVLVKSFFGLFYVVIPHGFILALRSFVVSFIVMIAFWAILFTGRFPESMHGFVVGTIRWQYRMSLYMMYMSDEYPPFTGKEE